MRLPEELYDQTHRRKQKIKARIARQAERERARMRVLPEFLLVRKPAHIFFMLAAMVLVGGMFLARVSTSFEPARDRMPEIVADGELRALRIALERFRRDCGRYPAPEEGLRALVLDPGRASGWSGPYVVVVKPDPWKQPYRYAVSNGSVQVWSGGPDRMPGTMDDRLPDVGPDELAAATNAAGPARSGSRF